MKGLQTTAGISASAGGPGSIDNRQVTSTVAKFRGQEAEYHAECHSRMDMMELSCAGHFVEACSRPPKGHIVMPRDQLSWSKCGA